MTHTKVGYVGIDHHHRDPYLQLAARLPIEITAVCEPGETLDPAEIRTQAERPDEIRSGGYDLSEVLSGATNYGNVEELLANGDVDVLWVTYRNEAVPDIIDAAVEHGVDVVSEKPVARTAAELEPVARKAKKADVRVGTTFFYRYNPIAQELRSLVQDGFFGDVWSVDGRYIGSKLDYRDTSHYVYDDEVSRGGALQWIGLHWIDLFQYVLDDQIARVAARTPADTAGTFDEGMTIQFETEGGVLGTFQTGYYLSNLGKDTRFGVYGDRATADSPVHNNDREPGATVPLTLESDDPSWSGSSRRDLSVEFDYGEYPAWGDYVLDYFADFFAGRSSGSIPADVDDALATLRVLDAAYEAAGTDNWVKIASDGE